MQRSLIAGFRILNLRVYYAVVAVVIVFYMAFSHKSYLSIYHFFRRRFGFSPVKSFFYVYRNHFAFGQVVVDRFAVYAGKKFQVETDGQELADKLQEAEEGFVQMSAHVGNCELAGYLLVSAKKRLNALIFGGETQTVMQNRNRIFAHQNVRLIAVKPDLSHIFMLNDALANGEAVSILADRTFGSQKTVSVPFFGEEARLPMGPFLLAVDRGVEAAAFFVMKESAGKYKIRVRSITADRSLPRRRQIEETARNFAAELERVVRDYPTQWFNYYEFWKQ